MPVNPITLDKLDPLVINGMQVKMVDTIVHEIKESGISRDNKDKEDRKNDEECFNDRQQDNAGKEFKAMLAKYGLILEYRMYKKRIRIKIKDKNGNILIDTIVDNMVSLLDSVRKKSGSLIDVRG